MNWRRAGAAICIPEVTYVYFTDERVHETYKFDGFTTNAHNIPPYILTSIATLRGAQFSNNSYVLECYTGLSKIQPNSQTVAVMIEGVTFTLQPINFYLAF